MADYSAVLRKTIDGLKENTPAMREKVYQKARATVDAKLAAVSPAPPPAVIERQKTMLEDAIRSVETHYAEPVPVEEPEEEPGGPEFLVTHDPEPTETPPDVSDETVTAAGAEAYHGSEADAPAAEEETDDAASAEAERDEDEIEAPIRDEAPSAPPPPVSHRPRPERKRKGRGGLVAALVVLLLVAVGGYALWLNRESFADVPGVGQLVALVGGTGSQSSQPSGTGASGEDAADEASGAGQEDEAASEAGTDATANGADTATGEDEAQTASAANGSEDASETEAPKSEKFTQRLLPGGGEVDAGPSSDEPTIGEGTSVAAATAPPREADPSSTASDAQAEDLAAGDSDQQVPVSQRAIFYEERTNSAQGSAESGSVVWSVVQESPGNDLPPEPAIRGEATIPGKDLQLRITIRRNADKSLPASHIVEMIFLTPDDFKGGGIDNVLRIALKRSEQDTGNPLLGIPAKIADGFFLYALNNTKAEEQTNLTLLRRQQWIDIPMIYKSGRRALITLEKGVPGDKVFDQALDAWEKASSG